MKSSKALITLSALTVLISGSTVLAKPVFAQTGTKYPTLIQRLIDKFKLNTTEVDKLRAEVQEQRQEQRTEQRTQRVETRLKEIESKLDEAIKAGKITQDQKAQIIAKFNEFQAQMEKEREQWQSLTWEQRQEQKAQRQEQKQQRAAWWTDLEKELGIDVSSIIGCNGEKLNRFLGQMGGRKGNR